MEVKLSQRSHPCPENARKSVSLLSDPVQMPEHHLNYGLLVVSAELGRRGSQIMGENIEVCLVMVKH